MDNEIIIDKVNVFYDNKQALDHISLRIKRDQITSFIGPSGCGKSTLIRCLNRMNDLIDICKVTGSIIIDGIDINSPKVNPVVLRMNVGMVFQKPNPFPKSIFDNVAYGLKIHGLYKNKQDIFDKVCHYLDIVGLYNEVSKRLNDSALGLSGGQQQRLCIARTLAIEPNILLMDEPCSALDPVATAKVENLLEKLSNKYTIVIVTHSMQQAARISLDTAFFHMGSLIEFGKTREIFSNPKNSKTEDYITGRIG